jgi:type I restriction enzyme, S subunit
MKANYKKLGPYIRAVKEKNNLGSSCELMGVNIDKFFMPSVANIVGTDLSKYKVVKPGHFACNRMHVGRDERLPVALSREVGNIIVSPAYDVFEVIDEKELLSEYLMMWFSRKEFDRNTWFHTDADVRGGLPWEDFCDLELPIPSIEKQKEIVAEYNTIVNRIKLNEQLNQKLEETAQAIYKRWFVDFEFPDENGNPYKSSGGEMKYCEESDSEKPVGWESKQVKDIAEKVICGKTPSTQDESNFGTDIPFLTIPDMHNKVFAHNTARNLSMKGANTQPNKTLRPKAICVSCIASPGIVIVTTKECQTNQQINSVICKSGISYCYAYFVLSALGQKIKEWGIKGSVGSNMNKTEFEAMAILLAPNHLIADFHKIIEPIFLHLKHSEKEGLLLYEIKEIITSRLAFEK